MADNYLEFSEVIPQLASDEAAWLDDQLRSIAVIDAVVYRLDEVPDELDAQKATYRGPKFLLNAKHIDIWGDEPDFSFAFQQDQHNGHRSRQLWIYSDSYGCLDQVAVLVQKFLRKFRPDDIWTIGYAATCSKPRVGEFGGGVVIVTPKGVRWLDSGAIAAKAIAAHERRRSVAA